MVWLVLLQIFLIALNAIFAGTEIAVISVNETKLEKEVERGNKRAKWLLKMTQNSSGFLATIQVAISQNPPTVSCGSAALIRRAMRRS